MTQSTISQQDALEIIADVINESVADVQPGVELESLEGWDSMAVLLLMAEFDERFDIVLDEDRIETLGKVDDILSVLQENNILE